MGLGIIGMKVFADAAMYHKEPRWSKTPEDVFRKIGTPELPSRPLIEYSLTTPGVHTLIIGIGQIDEDPMKCQLVQNFYAAQIEPHGMSAEDRKKIEEQAKNIRPESNYFQVVAKENLSAPRDVQLTDNKITWQTSYADEAPVSYYEVLIGGQLAGKVEHKPQLLKSHPFTFQTEKAEGEIIVVAVDAAGNRAESKLA